MERKASTGSPLLDLPAELRLKIYHHIGLKTQSFLFRGLLLSCRQLRDEVEPELSKVIQREVEDIADAIRAIGDEIVYTPPTNFHGWLNLTVSRPKRANMFHKQDPFNRFKYIYFDTFTVKFHNHDSGFEFRRDSPDTYQYAVKRLAHMIGECYDTDWFPAMRRWVLDWSDYPQLRTVRHVDGFLYLWRRSAWEMETYRMLKNDVEWMTGVCFSRIDKKRGKKYNPDHKLVELPTES